MTKIYYDNIFDVLYLIEGNMYHGEEIGMIIDLTDLQLKIDSGQVTYIGKL